MSAEPTGERIAAPERSFPAGSGGPPAPESRARRLARSRLAAFVALAAAVLGYAGAWTRGALLIDGPGIAVYVRLVLDHLSAHGRVSYWLPEMWVGTPVW